MERMAAAAAADRCVRGRTAFLYPGSPKGGTSVFKRLFTTRSICLSGIIAALYAALTLLLAPISYGNIQCRVSEALTILPVLFPEAIPGLTVGCLIANLIGSATPWDVIFGTLATLLAAVLSWLTRKTLTRAGKVELPLLSAVWPVLSNAVIVGLVLSFTFGLPLFLTMLEVGVGEAVAVAIGVALYPLLVRANLDRYLGIVKNTGSAPAVPDARSPRE